MINIEDAIALYSVLFASERAGIHLQREVVIVFVTEKLITHLVLTHIPLNILHFVVRSVIP